MAAESVRRSGAEMRSAAEDDDFINDDSEEEEVRTPAAEISRGNILRGRRPRRATRRCVTCGQTNGPFVDCADCGGAIGLHCCDYLVCCGCETSVLCRGCGEDDMGFCAAC